MEKQEAGTKHWREQGTVLSGSVLDSWIRSRWALFGQVSWHRSGILADVGNMNVAGSETLGVCVCGSANDGRSFWVLVGFWTVIR